MLKRKEKVFCMFYAGCGNVWEAAKKAGYREPEKQGRALLGREDIIGEINRLYERNLRNARQQAYSGYERLAFGSVRDAVELLFAGDTALEQEKEPDLFNVAEIKRPKEGAMEIKFFDRFKALEKLEQWGSGENNCSSDFYKAIIGGIKDTEGEEQEEV